MKHLLPQSVRSLPAILMVSAAALLPLAAHADDASKKALAVQLAQLQLKSSGNAMATELTQMALAPAIQYWTQQVEARVPQAQQKDVSEKLNAALKTFGDNSNTVISNQATKTAQDVLVPLFMSKLSEADLKIIVTYLSTPASSNFAALGNEAANDWAKKVIEGTNTQVTQYRKTFDDTATKIVNVASPNTTPSGASPAPDGAASKK